MRGQQSSLASQTTEDIKAKASVERCAAYHSNRRCMAVEFADNLLTTYTVDLKVNRADDGTLRAVEKRSFSLYCKALYSLADPLGHRQ